MVGTFALVSAQGCSDDGAVTVALVVGGEGGRADEGATEAGSAGADAAPGRAGGGAATAGGPPAMGGAPPAGPAKEGGAAGGPVAVSAGGTAVVLLPIGEAGSPGPDRDVPIAGGTAGEGGAAGAADIAGEAGAAGAPPVLRTTSLLGAPCAAAEDCGGGGYHCLTEDEDFQPGVIGSFPNGVCTADCADDSDCKALDPLGVCFEPGLCLQGCTLDSAPEDKCQGRYDVACSLLQVEDEPDLCGPSGRSCESGELCYKGHCNLPHCWPQCTSDTDCAEGRYCDVRWGTCETTPPPPSDFGADCASGNACRAGCLSVFSGQNIEISKFCTESCVQGFTCAEERGACVYLSYAAGDFTPGNSGYCAPFCDCNDDCEAQGMACEPIHSSWGRPGICTVPIDENGSLRPTIACDASRAPGVAP